MLQKPIFSYTHLPGWKTLIDQLVEQLDAATGAHAFRMADLKEKYGSLRIEIEPIDDAPSEIVEAAEKLISQAEEKSEHTCIDCGKPALLHEWNTDWTLPCCPEHARGRAKNVTNFYNGPGWKLTTDFRIVDEAGEPLSHDKIRALDLAATQEERPGGKVPIIDAQSADWHAARWMSQRSNLEIGVEMAEKYDDALRNLKDK
jgi:hypothetical protein